MYTPEKLVVKTFAELTTEELYEILKARFSVFVVEQHCFYLDMDDIDYRSFHVCVCEGRKVVAYGRLFEDEEPNAWHIGRVLTTKRGVGLGRRLMEAIMQTAYAHGATALRMDAQSHAVGFYEKLGFVVCSDEFDEAGIPHKRMERLGMATGSAPRRG